MVAALVGVTLLPLYDMLTSSERGSKSSLNRVRATNYAADLLETLKAIPYDQLPVTQENGVAGWPDNEAADHVPVGVHVLDATSAPDADPLRGVAANYPEPRWGAMEYRHMPPADRFRVDDRCPRPRTASGGGAMKFAICPSQVSAACAVCNQSIQRPLGRRQDSRSDTSI